MPQGFNLDKFGISLTRNLERSSHEIHKYFLENAKIPFLQNELNTYSVVESWCSWKGIGFSHQFYLIKITKIKNIRFGPSNYFGPSTIKILGSAYGPSSFSTWALSSMATIICWRISSDCLVLPLVIGPCIWATLGFSSTSVEESPYCGTYHLMLSQVGVWSSLRRIRLIFQLRSIMMYILHMSFHFFP